MNRHARRAAAAKALASPVAAVPALAGVTGGSHPDAALIEAARAAVGLWNAVDHPDFHAGRRRRVTSKRTGS